MTKRTVQGLYVVTDEAVWGRTHLEMTRAAIDGGAAVVQLRDKNRTDRELWPIACAFTAMCREADVVSMIDDRCDLAVAARADGVHIGRNDLPIAAARAVVGAARIIGVSCYGDLEATRTAEDEGADYIAVGAVFPTSTKEAAVTGIEIVSDARARVRLPIVGIGGIDHERAASVIEAGADAVAVVSAIARAPDMTNAVRTLARRIHRG